jgi:predicted PurR-regulated permease PerM
MENFLIQSLAYIERSPLMAFFIFTIVILFVFVIPLVRYIIKWAEKLFEYMMKQAEKREDDYKELVNTTLKDMNINIFQNTQHVSKLNSNIEILNDNLNDISKRVNNIEGILEIENKVGE